MLTIVFKDRTVVHSSEQIPELFTDDSVLAVISCDVALVEIVATLTMLQVQPNVTYCTVFDDGTTIYHQDPTHAFAYTDEVVVIKFTNSVNLYSMTVARNPIKLQRQLEELLSSYPPHAEIKVGDLVRILEELPPDLHVLVENCFLTNASFSLYGVKSLIIRGKLGEDRCSQENSYSESFLS
jgi:hypothetical protein